MAPDAVKLRKQVDYYFSDSNFPRDKFLRTKSEEDENGFVDISVLLTFNRLKVLGATVEEISKAAVGSKIVVLDDSKKRLRRKDPLPDANLWKTRTLYAKGWTAGDDFPSIDTLIQLFSPSGDVLMVKRRFWNDDDGKHFKGSIFAEFATPEMAERAAAEEYTIKVKGEDGKMVDKKLIALMAEDYFLKKKQEKIEWKLRKSQAKKERENAKVEDSNGAKKEKDKAEDTNGTKKENGVVEKSEDKLSVKAEDKCEVKAEDEKPYVKKEPRPEMVRGNLVRGLVVRFEGMKPDMNRMDIKEAFQVHGDVTWVAFQTGDTEGLVRYTEPSMAQKALKTMTEDKTKVGGNVLTLKLLEGEEEETYWNGIWDIMDASKKRKFDNAGGGRRGRGRGSWKRRRGGGGFRGGGYRGRGRGRK